MITKYIRLLSKLAVESKVLGDAERRTGVYTLVHEDSSTASTTQFAATVEFGKKSITGLSLIIITLYSTSALAAIDHGKYHDYRVSQQNAEVQKMQDFHLEQARTKLHSQQLTHAWGDLAYLLCHVPNHHLALQHMLSLAPQLNKQQELQAFLKTAVELFPSDSVLHVLYGAFLYNIGDEKDATQQMQIAQELEPEGTKLILPKKNLATQQ